MGKLTAKDLVESVKQIGTLPDLYTRLTSVINKPTSSAAEIGSVVTEDPGLSARLLRIVNSAFYNFPRKIDTISRAIVIVGTTELRDLALATTVISMFKNVPKDLVDMESFWRHSLAVGLFAREIAMRRHEPSTERFFVSGLLHDVGKLVIYMKQGELARQALEHSQENSTLHYKSESSIIGFNHAHVGSALVGAWNLPPRLQQAVGFHHTPQLATEYPLDAATTHVANILTNACQMGSSGESFVPPLSHVAWESLKLNPNMIPSLVKSVEKIFEDTVQNILVR